MSHAATLRSRRIPSKRVARSIPRPRTLGDIQQLRREIAAEEILGRTLGHSEGSWVALREHEVVADALTLDALLGKIEGTPVDGVIQVPSGRCFF